MISLRTTAVLLVGLLSGSALAQGMGEASPDSPVIDGLAGLHQMTSANLVATAETLDEEMYAFRPTEEVRTAGQILAHVANAQYMFCSAAAGEENPNGENFEESATTKAEVTAALEAAFAYCTEVYAGLTDEDGAERRTFFGNEMAVSAILAFNTTHNYEHYGNLVTYMRMNGVVPPSSQR